MAYYLSIYALASVVAALFNLCLGYVVFKKRPHHPLNRVFGLIILSCVVWPFSEFILRTTENPQVADIFARIAWMPILLSSALILHLVLIMTKIDLPFVDRSKVVAAVYLASMLFIVLNFTTNTVVSGAYREYWGYTGSFGFVFRDIYSVYHIGIVVVALYLLDKRYKITRNSIERIQIKYVFAGLSFPYVIGTLTQIVLPILGYTSIPIASFTTIVMDGFIAYAIIRYKLLVIAPTTEKQVYTKPKYNLELKTYLIPAEEGDKAMEMYVDQIVHGRQGLCVTLAEPSEIRRKYQISKTPIIWLTDKETRHRSTPPNDLEQLTLHLKDFFKISAENSILLLDGVDRLIEVNGFDKVYYMIKELNEAIHRTKIIPIKKKEDLELIRLQLKKDDVEKEIYFARNMFHQGKIDEQGFREIVKEYEKKLIELNLEMSKLDKKKLKEDIEIID